MHEPNAVLHGAKDRIERAQAHRALEAFDCCVRLASERGIRAYIATGRAKHPADAKRRLGGELTQAMRRKLKRAGWRSRYRFRKQIPAFAGTSPVFGQIKQARGFRQFLLRGVAKLRAEWAIICTAHNLLKLARAA